MMKKTIFANSRERPIVLRETITHKFLLTPDGNHVRRMLTDEEYDKYNVSDVIDGTKVAGFGTSRRVDLKNGKVYEMAKFYTK